MLSRKRLAASIHLAWHASDPGLLRLIQAGKTVLAVILAFALFWKAPREARLFASIGAAFIMQCTPAGTRRLRQGAMLLSGCAMTLVVGIAAYLAPHPLFRDALIVVLAAVVFWVRRFLPGRDSFPIFAFTLSLIASELNGGPEGWAWEALAVASATGIAFVIFFYTPSRSADRAVADAIGDFRRRCGLLLAELGQLDAGEFRRFRVRHEVRTVQTSPDLLKSIFANHPNNDAAPLFADLQSAEYQAIKCLFVIRAAIERLDWNSGATQAIGWGCFRDEIHRLASQLLASRALSGHRANRAVDGGAAGDSFDAQSTRYPREMDANLLAGCVAASRLSQIDRQIGQAFPAHER